MKKAMIELEQFCFKYTTQQENTLHDIHLTIYQGEKVLIVGPSGSGKSTLGQCLNGIIPNIYKGSYTGQFRMNGREAFDQSIYEKSLLVSTVLQDTDGQFIGLSVAEDLAFALENDVVPLEEMKQRIQMWAERLELENLLNHRPQDLSGGQKQRVSLAGVLIDESPILLFDEPLANLDPKSGQETIKLIDRLHKEQQATTIIIEHRLEDVLYREVDRIILINEGRIIYNGEVDSLLRTNLLHENGIREPLYLTTLRYLDYDIGQEKTLSSVAQLSLANLTRPSLPSPVIDNSCHPPLVEVRDLRVAYDDKEVIKGITVPIYKGERLAIIGKNGAGKSTFAKALCRFVEVSGDILWEGHSVLTDSVKERAERIGYVLQNPNQMISQTMIFDEVALGLRLRGIAEELVQQKVEAALRTCGLYAFRKWPISALSYGQKKRVTIAAILVLQPDIILLDEPTAGQDQRNYTEMMDFLDDLNKQGHTIIMITHDMQLMLDYSDRAMVVVDGQVIHEAAPATILTNQDLIHTANLKETSIFQLAEKIGVDPLALTQLYMERKRREK